MTMTNDNLFGYFVTTLFQVEAITSTQWCILERVGRARDCFNIIVMIE